MAKLGQSDLTAALLIGAGAILGARIFLLKKHAPPPEPDQEENPPPAGPGMDTEMLGDAPPMSELERQGMIDASQIFTSPARQIANSCSVAAAAGVTEDQQAQMAMHALHQISPPLDILEDPVGDGMAALAWDRTLTRANRRSAESARAAMQNALETGYRPGEDSVELVSSANQAAAWQAQRNSAKGGMYRNQIVAQLETELARQERDTASAKAISNQLNTQPLDQQQREKLLRTLHAYDRELVEGGRRIATLKQQLQHVT